jgi:hypothetical protein
MANPFVKLGPFVNGSTPALSAANLNLWDQGIFDAWPQRVTALMMLLSGTTSPASVASLSGESVAADLSEVCGARGPLLAGLSFVLDPFSGPSHKLNIGRETPVSMRVWPRPCHQ